MGFTKASCTHCGREFQAHVIPSEPRRGKFCSLPCFHASNTIYPPTSAVCPVCAKEFLPNRMQRKALGTGRQKVAYCSSGCYRKHLPIKRKGEGNSHWRGGRVHSRGYIYLREDRHPVSSYVAEHRKIVEEQLGRLLTRYEIVHHVNGDKTDNSPGNLKVLTISEHMKVHALARS